MLNNPEKFNNQYRIASNRLAGYDYTQPGAYYITVCTYYREHLFGTIVDGVMQMTEGGKIVQDEWFKSSQIRAEIELDEFVVMPNHIHGIVIIVGGNKYVDSGCRDDRRVVSANTNTVSIHPTGPKPKSIGAFMGGFKSSVTKRINQIRKTPGAPVWQRNYHEHIIRNNQELNRIRAYIANNPSNWLSDRNR